MVLIPAGTCHWGVASVSHSGGVWLRGAGKSQTVLTREATSDTYMMTLECPTATSRMRVSGMTLRGSATSTGDEDGIALGTKTRPCLDFQVHDLKLTEFSESALEVNGKARGVVHHNEFIHNFRIGLGYGVVVYGDDTWGPLSLGSPDAVFVEDNEFYAQRHAIAANHGARYVFRHNRVRTSVETRNWTMVDLHGTKESKHGTRSAEVYGNTFEVDADVPAADAIGFRGGDGVVFDNVFDPHVVYVVGLIIEAGCVGKTYPIAGQTTDLWLWNNTLSDGATETVWGTPPDFVRVYADCASFFLAGRDFHQEPRSGYVPYRYPHPLR